MSRRPFALTLVLSAAALAGCRGRTPGTVPWTRPTDFPGVRPTLEEIFRDPPIRGNPPRIDRLSPDGRFLLFYWSPLGPEELEGNDLDLRLLDVAAAPGSMPQGRLLVDLLPRLGRPSDDVQELGPVEWSHRGHLLAIGRGTDILLLDPASGRAVPFLFSENAPPVDPQEPTPPVAPTGRTLEGNITSLAFQSDDRRLRFADAHELYDLPVDELPAQPWALDDARWWSEDLAARALSLRWSHDLQVVFGFDPLPLEAGTEEDTTEKESADEEGTEETEEEVTDEESSDEQEGVGDESEEDVIHVYRIDEKRGVSLADVQDLSSFEDAAISPGGRFLFAAEYDRSAEPEPTLVPDYLTERVTTRQGRRQLADGVPSPFELRIWRTSTGARVPVLPRGGPVTWPEEDGASSDYWLRTVDWAPQPLANSPARFAFELWSADYRELTLWVWTEGFAVPVWTERDEAWVGGEARTTRWSPDGSRLILGSESAAGSSTPGRSQLFSVDPDTGESVQLTAVEGAVRGFNVLQEGGVVFRASRLDPSRLSLGHLTPDMVAGRFRPEVRWLTTPVGWNSTPVGARDGSRIVYTHERLFEPTELRCWSATGDHALTDTRPPEFDAVEWIHPERLELDTADGRRVRAHVFLPHGTSLAPSSSQPRRATIVFVHGAGYLQNVTDSMTRYPMNLLFHSRLAAMGYPVIDVDYRGSAGYGRDFRTDVQYHLGGKDLEDIHRVVDELVGRGLVDPTRVGIYGGSYGGFMTLMALFTAPERWAAGAALRSVTDWRTYHPAYTQPRLGRPSTHPEAFARSSPLDHATKLEDPLLILHGLMDSNVFAQDSVRLIEELIDHGLDFEAMLYPSQGHGFDDAAHWLDEYRRIERFLLQHLGPPVSGT